jgi:hypothetical protein
MRSLLIHDWERRVHLWPVPVVCGRRVVRGRDEREDATGTGQRRFDRRRGRRAKLLPERALPHRGVLLGVIQEATENTIGVAKLLPIGATVLAE